MNSKKTNSNFTESLKHIYSKYFDAEYLEQNLFIPRVYSDSIEKLKIKELFDSRGSLSNTQWGIEVYGEDFLVRKNSHRLNINDKLFLAIGEWGSNHLFLMCCDKSSGDFGKVFDYNDAHPWCDSDNHEVEWGDFADFVKDEYKIELTAPSTM